MALGLLLLCQLAKAGTLAAHQQCPSGAKVSTKRCRFRPITFFPASKPRCSGLVSHFNRLSVENGRGRGFLQHFSCVLCLILVAVVHSAAIQDRDGAKLVIEQARWCSWLRVIFADAAYSGQLATCVREFFGHRAHAFLLFQNSEPTFAYWLSAGSSRELSLRLPSALQGLRSQDRTFRGVHLCGCNLSYATAPSPSNDFCHRF